MYGWQQETPPNLPRSHETRSTVAACRSWERHQAQPTLTLQPCQWFQGLEAGSTLVNTKNSWYLSMFIPPKIWGRMAVDPQFELMFHVNPAAMRHRPTIHSMEKTRSSASSQMAPKNFSSNLICVATSRGFDTFDSNLENPFQTNHPLTSPEMGKKIILIY